MPVGLTLLLACVVVLATWVVLHGALVLACFRAPSLSRRDRWLSAFPLCTGWFAWRAGHRRTVIAWTCLIVLYASLRLALGAR